jgi:hypothetical protein
MKPLKAGVVALRMDRRQLLARFGAVLGTASLGGCLERYRDVAGETGDETTEDADAEETTTETAEGELSVADQTFEIVENECGEPKNEASVEFDSAATSVALTGTIAGSDACHIAELADASYDPDTGSFDVTVVSKKEEGADVCAQCIVEIDYEATFDFDGGPPESVTVVHESMGESVTVVEAQSD